MAEFWESGIIRNRDVARAQASHQLALLGTAERLRRVVLQAYIDVDNASSDQALEWTIAGVLSLIEVTRGSPPPTPEPVGLGNFNTRDIVFSQFAAPTISQFLTGISRVPGLTGLFDIDVSVSRGDGTSELAVWWVWGLPDTTVSGVAAGFERAWFRVLADTV